MKHRNKMKHQAKLNKKSSKYKVKTLKMIKLLSNWNNNKKNHYKRHLKMEKNIKEINKTIFYNLNQVNINHQIKL